MAGMAKPWRIASIAFALTACAAAPPPAAKPVPAKASTDFLITETAMGRIGATTRSTLESLRTVLADYEVRPVYDGGLEYHVYRGGVELYYVIPTTNAGDKLFNVHIVSGTFTVANHPWRAGKPFSGASVLTKCECWGDQPVCYKEGEHIAVAFKRACAGLSDAEDARARVVLDGVAVQRMVWSPSAFGMPDAAGSPEGVEGGVEGGEAGAGAGD